MSDIEDLPFSGLVTYGHGSDAETESEPETDPSLTHASATISKTSIVMSVGEDQTTTFVSTERHISVTGPVGHDRDLSPSPMKKPRLGSGLLPYAYDDDDEDEEPHQTSPGEQSEATTAIYFTTTSSTTVAPMPEKPLSESHLPRVKSLVDVELSPSEQTFPSLDADPEADEQVSDAISTDDEERETRRHLAPISEPSSPPAKSDESPPLSKTSMKPTSVRRPPTPPPSKLQVLEEERSSSMRNSPAYNQERRGIPVANVTTSSDGVHEILLPPEPPADLVDPKLQDIVQRTIDRMRRDPQYDPNKVIQDNKMFRNPSIYEKLVTFVNIDEKGSNFPKDKYNPQRWVDSASYYDELAKAQDAYIKRREQQKRDAVPVVTASSKKLEFVTVVKSASGVTRTESASSTSEKKRSKWDAPPSLTSSKSAGVGAAAKRAS